MKKRGKTTKKGNNKLKLRQKTASKPRMPCQSKKVDFERIYFEERKTNAELSKLYLLKISEIEKKSSKMLKKWKTIKQENKILEAQLKKQMKANRKVIDKNKMLEMENNKLRTEMEESNRFYREKLKTQIYRAKNEDAVKNEFYESKINEMRDIYRALSPSLPKNNINHDVKLKTDKKQFERRVSGFESTKENFAIKKVVEDQKVKPMYNGDIANVNDKLKAIYNWKQGVKNAFCNLKV